MNMTYQKSPIIRWSWLALLPGLMGCATPKQPDPLEGFNRGMFLINKKLDQVIIKPVSTFYDTVLPTPVKTMVLNFFDNIAHLPTIANDILQWNWPRVRADTARFILNSTWGIGGLFDVATKAGIEKRTQDVGHTLAHWGYKNSAYLVLPILGPSTIRDTIGRYGTYYMTPYPYFRQLNIEPRARIRNSLFVTQYISTRADMLKAEKIVNEVAVDEYVFVRDAYLQNREGNSTGTGLSPTADAPMSTGPSTGSEGGGGSLEHLQGPPE